MVKVNTSVKPNLVKINDLSTTTTTRIEIKIEATGKVEPLDVNVDLASSFGWAYGLRIVGFVFILGFMIWGVVALCKEE